MPKDNKQKIKLLYLMEVLRQETDEQHPMSTNQICKRLGEQGICARAPALDRRPDHKS